MLFLQSFQAVVPFLRCCGMQNIAILNICFNLGSTVDADLDLVNEAELHMRGAFLAAVVADDLKSHRPSPGSSIDKLQSHKTCAEVFGDD